MGNVSYTLGEYAAAREQYQLALKMEEEMGRSHRVKILQEKLEKLAADEAAKKDE